MVLDFASLSQWSVIVQWIFKLMNSFYFLFIQIWSRVSNVAELWEVDFFAIISSHMYANARKRCVSLHTPYWEQQEILQIAWKILICIIWIYHESTQKMSFCSVHWSVQSFSVQLSPTFYKSIFFSPFVNILTHELFYSGDLAQIFWAYDGENIAFY